ncbi:hypothetical protein JHK85_040981 [Glycine max]|nr:hypothetical protein JHK86_040394 [Glycine max]KAG4966006.1 hypothetical protein JHK85_040981 [Glycine max]
MLESKYLRQGESLLQASTLDGASYTWNSIVKATNHLHLGFQYRLGRGDISLWYDKWLTDDYLCHLVPFVNIQDTQLKAQNIFQDGIWHFEKLSTPLPMETKKEIQIYILNDNMEDVIVWGPSGDEIFTATTAFKWLIAVNSLPTSQFGNWSWIWKLQILENIKHFFWLTFHGSLLTNDFRVFRHLAVVWQFLHLDHDSNFYVANCVDWIVNNINSVRGILFAVTCWTIWKSRNSLIFQNKRWTTWQIINQVNILSNDVINTLQQPTQPRMGRNVSWDPPTFPFVKLNTDGSSIGNPGDSGYGGIIRDLAGNMLTAFSGECGTTSSLKAKLLAIYYGLRTAWDNGYTHNEVNEYHPYSPLVQLIHHLLALTWIVSFKHTLREENAYADWLAKYGATHAESYKIWNVCPSQLSTLVMTDKMGAFHFRIGAYHDVHDHGYSSGMA